MKEQKKFGESLLPFTSEYFIVLSSVWRPNCQDAPKFVSGFVWMWGFGRTWTGMFQNRVLRTIFVPKREEVVEGWRKLHNEELHNLYSSPSINYGDKIILDLMWWVVHISRMNAIRNTYGILGT
jgi:hypothetical protein